MKFGSLSSLVQDFRRAGASAVVGTECNITADLGALFIDEVLHALYAEGLSLGEAIQRFNQRRFLAGNPLSFVFTCFGNTDLKIT